MLDMPKTPPKNELSAIHARGWKMVLNDSNADTDQDVFMIHEPYDVLVSLLACDVGAALTEQTSDKTEAMTIIWMPPGVNMPAGIGNCAEVWLQEDVSPLRRGAVRAGTRSIRAFWSDHRALIYTNAEHVADALEAIIRFTAFERETVKLEWAMKSIWSCMQSDLQLTGASTGHQQRLWSHVSKLTELVTKMKVTHLQLTRGLEQTDQTLSESSRRLFSELVLAATLYDRIGELEDPIQFALEHYELANTRLIEAKNAAVERLEARIGHSLEVGIIVLLIYPLHLFW